MIHRHTTAALKQRGQGMSEYIIITALVAVAGVGLFAFGDVLQNQMAGNGVDEAQCFDCSRFRRSSSCASKRIHRSRSFGSRAIAVIRRRASCASRSN